MSLATADLPSDPEALRAFALACQAELAATALELKAAQLSVQLRTLEIEKLKFQIAKLRRMQFGRSSERIARQIEQLELQLEELETGAAQEEAEAAIQDRLPSGIERAKPKRRPLPEHLPRQQIVHEPVNDGACTCPECGAGMARLGEDITEVLDYVPGHFLVIRHVRPKYACKSCDAITQAPAAAMPTPRGRAAPGMLAHVLVSKYCDHLPLYRQSEIYAREGLDLDRSTLCDWVGQAAWLLQPIVAGIRKRLCCREDPRRRYAGPGAVAEGWGGPRPGGCGSTCATIGRSAAQPRRPPPISTAPIGGAPIRRFIWRGSRAFSRSTPMPGSKHSTTLPAPCRGQSRKWRAGRIADASSSTYGKPPSHRSPRRRVSIGSLRSM